MLCTNPKYAQKINGKLKIVEIDKRQKINPLEIMPVVRLKSGERVQVRKLPCGECLLCRWERSNEWALRCKLEAGRFERNMFITLTYNWLWERRTGAHVTHSDLRRFLKNLRTYFYRHLGLTGIRFFACGEYGRESFRPHYHLILFNCPHFGDEKAFAKDKAGFPLYKSNILNRLWGRGFCSIGEVSDHSIDYVTRSRVKDCFIKTKKKKGYPAFITMSRLDGGLGGQYFKEHFDEIVKNDCIVYNGKRYPIPRGFNRKLEEIFGNEEYKKRFSIPRKKRAEALLKKEAEQHHLTLQKALWQRKNILTYEIRVILSRYEKQEEL